MAQVVVTGRQQQWLRFQRRTTVSSDPTSTNMLCSSVSSRMCWGANGYTEHNDEEGKKPHQRCNTALVWL